MLYRILTVAIFVLLSWLLFQQKQEQQLVQTQFSAINDVLLNPESSEEQKKKEKQTADTLLQLQESLQNIESKQKQKFQGKIDQLSKTVGIYKTLTKFDEAENLLGEKKNNEAAELIISTKGAIWKAGDTFKDQQKALRDMMGPIDSAGNNWKQGNLDPSPKSLKNTLAKIIKNIGGNNNE